MAKHMTQDDRKTLEARYNAGQSVAGIARAMQFNYSTIYKELKRGDTGRWTPMAVLGTAQRWDSSACTTRSSSSGIGLTARRVRRMLELAIWMYHIGNPDPVVRAITDVATGLVILWGVVNHYAKKESDKEFMDVYNEM